MMKVFVISMFFILSAANAQYHEGKKYVNSFDKLDSPEVRDLNNNPVKFQARKDEIKAMAIRMLQEAYRFQGPNPYRSDIHMMYRTLRNATLSIGSIKFETEVGGWVKRGVSDHVTLSYFSMFLPIEIAAQILIHESSHLAFGAGECAAERRSISVAERTSLSKGRVPIGYENCLTEKILVTGKSTVESTAHYWSSRMPKGINPMPIFIFQNIYSLKETPESLMQQR